MTKYLLECSLGTHEVVHDEALGIEKMKLCGEEAYLYRLKRCGGRHLVARRIYKETKVPYSMLGLDVPTFERNGQSLCPYQKPLTEEEKANLRRIAAIPSYPLQWAKWEDPDKKPND